MVRIGEVFVADTSLIQRIQEDKAKSNGSRYIGGQLTITFQSGDLPSHIVGWLDKKKGTCIQLVSTSKS